MLDAGTRKGKGMYCRRVGVEEKAILVSLEVRKVLALAPRGRESYGMAKKMGSASCVVNGTADGD